jgi:hypothetical protein
VTHILPPGAGRSGMPIPPPGDGQSLPGFPGSRRVRPKTPMPGGRLRPRWRVPDGRIFEWDFQHGTVEGYDGRRGRHLGEFDPITGAMRQGKGPLPGRKVDP